ncbi:MAG: leucine-rich repeat domain-containing protein [Treponema sp.]|nr:leucine-rich repeat domain-containing protein [Treponema sp.]
MKKFFTILLSIFIATTAFAQKIVEVFPGEKVKLEFFDGRTFSGKLNVLNSYPETVAYNESTREVTGKQLGTSVLTVLWGSEREIIYVNVVAGKLSEDGTFTIGDNVTTIKLRDVQNKDKIKKIVFGKNLNTIEGNVFFNLPNLEGELVIPGNVKNIGDMAFGYCPKLTSVVLEEGVESLGSAPFNCSDGVKKVTLPKSLKSVKNSLGLMYGSIDVICDEDSYAEEYFKKQRYYVPSCFKVIGDTLVVKEGTVYFPENYKGKGTVKNIVLPDSIFPDKFDKIISQDVKIYCNNGTPIALECRDSHPNYEIITPQTVIPGVIDIENSDAITRMAQDKTNKVEPLLRTVWGQREGKLRFAENKQAATCEPVAVANLLFYHNIPLSGNHYYKTSKKEYFQDFDRFNADYSQCLLDMTQKTVDAQHYDTDLLLYNCAIVLNRDWLNATREYYGIENMVPDYAPVKIIRNSYAYPKYDYCKKTKEELEMIIKTNLLQKHPLMYSIHSKDGKWNHLTIIDGYRYSASGVFEVHVDAGWEGKETKWAPLWGSFDAIDTNGLRTYDGEKRVIYEFIPLTGSEKENWKPKRVSEVQKKEYTKLINTELFYKHIQAEHRNDQVVEEEHLIFNEEEDWIETSSAQETVIPVKSILRTWKYPEYNLAIISQMSLTNPKVLLSDAKNGNAKVEMILLGTGINNCNSLEISYFGDSFIPVDGKTKLKLELPKTDKGIQVQSVCWDIPVPEKAGAYQIRVYADGKLVSTPLIYQPDVNFEILVYDEPRISEVIVNNVGVNAKSDYVKVTVIGEGFSTVDDPDNLFIFESKRNNMVKKTKVTVVTDRLAYIEITNPKKAGEYPLTIYNKNKKYKKQFTLSVKNYSDWKAGDFIYTDGTRSSERNTSKTVAAIIFGFTDEGTPLGVSLYDSYDDFGVGLMWAKSSGAKVSSYSNLLLTQGLIDEFSFGAWNYWKEFRLEVDKTTGEWKGDFDGKDNLAIIKSVDPVYSSPEKLAEYYPPFGYAENYATYHKELIGTEFEKGWYIPTMMELEIMANSLEVVSDSIWAANGSSPYGNYATSNTDGNIRCCDSTLTYKKTVHTCWNYHLMNYRVIRAF